MNELKPCPFCGSKPFVWRTNHRTYIECPNLTADSHRIMMSGKTDKEAIEEWNRRHNDGCSEWNGCTSRSGEEDNND